MFVPIFSCFDVPFGVSRFQFRNRFWFQSSLKTPNWNAEKPFVDRSRSSFQVVPVRVTRRSNEGHRLRCWKGPQWEVQ
jgi:hypothetical protein